MRFDEQSIEYDWVYLWSSAWAASMHWAHLNWMHQSYRECLHTAGAWGLSRPRLWMFNSRQPNCSISKDLVVKREGMGHKHFCWKTGSIRIKRVVQFCQELPEKKHFEEKSWRQHYDVIQSRYVIGIMSNRQPKATFLFIGNVSLSAVVFCC